MHARVCVASMLTRRRATRIDHAAGDADLVTGFQEMEQFVKIHAGRRTGVESRHPAEAFTDGFHQLAEADAARMAGNQVDDLVAVDGDGIGHALGWLEERTGAFGKARDKASL